MQQAREDCHGSTRMHPAGQEEGKHDETPTAHTRPFARNSRASNNHAAHHGPGPTATPAWIHTANATHAGNLKKGLEPRALNIAPPTYIDPPRTTMQTTRHSLDSIKRPPPSHPTDDAASVPSNLHNTARARCRTGKKIRPRTCSSPRTAAGTPSLTQHPSFTLRNFSDIDSTPRTTTTGPN